MTNEHYSAEERAAWDRYMAAALVQNYEPNWEVCSKNSDLALSERRKRFGIRPDEADATWDHAAESMADELRQIAMAAYGVKSAEELAGLDTHAPAIVERIGVLRKQLRLTEVDRNELHYRLARAESMFGLVARAVAGVPQGAPLPDVQRDGTTVLMSVYGLHEEVRQLKAEVEKLRGPNLNASNAEVAS